MYCLRASFAVLALLLGGCVAAPTDSSGGGGGGGGSGPGLGPNASLEGRRPFPPDNPWNSPVDRDLVDPNSDALIASIGLTKGFHPDRGDWFISDAPDARWDDADLNTLEQVQGSNFEVVRMGTVVTQ